MHLRLHCSAGDNAVVCNRGLGCSLNDCCCWWVLLLVLCRLQRCTMVYWMQH